MPSKSINCNNRKEAPSQQWIVFVCARGFFTAAIRHQSKAKSLRRSEGHLHYKAVLLQPCSSKLNNSVSEKRRLCPIGSYSAKVCNRESDPAVLPNSSFIKRKQAMSCKLTFHPSLGWKLFQIPALNKLDYCRQKESHSFWPVIVELAHDLIFLFYFETGQKRVQILLLEATVCK